jgi:threonine synthase
MNFKSTRNGQKEVSFRQAIFKGLADDGGLYQPVTIPDLRTLFNSFSGNTSFNQLAYTVTYELLKPEVTAESAQRIVENAYSFTPEITILDNSLSLLELYHGPSYAFKDFGACFLASAMEEFLSESDKQAVILVATSGDTGSAVAKAFYRKKNIMVVILYPSERISPLQEKQLTTLGENIQALEVLGNFDDCQRMVKEAFLDKELNNRLNLTSANSINLGRLIPQSFYYIYAYVQLKDRQDGPLVFAVPSGNFGNLTAGVYAWQWGLPVFKFIAATNINDVVPEYLNTGLFKPRTSKATLSNAMDVGNPSNFERLRSIFCNDYRQMNKMIYGEIITDEDTLLTIGRLYRKNEIFIDPHTAVGCQATFRAMKSLSLSKGRFVVLATAHAGKFQDTMKKATGVDIPLPEGLAKSMALPKHSVIISNNKEDLKQFLLDRYK